jgi:hypothetical protein
MIITNYHIEDVEDLNKLIHNLFVGLSYYKKKDPTMKFKIRYSKNTIELTTIKQNAYSLN